MKRICIRGTQANTFIYVNSYMNSEKSLTLKKKRSVGAGASKSDRKKIISIIILQNPILNICIAFTLRLRFAYI